MNKEHKAGTFLLRVQDVGRLLTWALFLPRATATLTDLVLVDDFCKFAAENPADSLLFLTPDEVVQVIGWATHVAQPAWDQSDKLFKRRLSGWIAKRRA